MENAQIAVARFLHGLEPRVKELPLEWLETASGVVRANLSGTLWYLLLYAEERVLTFALHHQRFDKQVYCPTMGFAETSTDPQSYEEAIRLLTAFCEMAPKTFKVCKHSLQANKN